MYKIILFFFCLVTFLLPDKVLAQNQQDSTKITSIQTRDGNEYNGIVIKEDEQSLILETKELGEITIVKSNIKKRTDLPLSNIVGGELWPENAQATRYIWGPNGIGVKKGEGYYQNLCVLYYQLSIGITNNFSIGVGLIPLFLFSPEAAEFSPIWITPKLSVPVKADKFSLGVGLLAGTAGFQGNAGFGILYGVGTVGNKNTNASFGLGYGYAGGEWGNSPLINLSVMHRTGRRGYIISENYIFPADNGSLVLLSFGGRTMTKSIGIDYGLFIPISGDTGFLGIPWLGITVPINFRKNSNK